MCLPMATALPREEDGDKGVRKANEKRELAGNSVWAKKGNGPAGPSNLRSQQEAGVLSALALGSCPGNRLALGNGLLGSRFLSHLISPFVKQSNSRNIAATPNRR
jgi:hypothetical protein